MKRKFNDSSCLPQSAVKRINPPTSATLFYKSNSWENFLHPLIKISSLFLAPYILENSQAFIFLQIFLLFLCPWTNEVGKFAMAWNQTI